MLEDILGVIGSAASGGLVGALGSLAKGWLEIKDRQADRAHQLELRKADLAEMKEEAALNLRKTETEIAGKKDLAEIESNAARDVAAAKLTEASFGHDKATYSDRAIQGLRGFFGSLARFMLISVDVTRGFMRPAITTFLLIISTVIAWELFKIIETIQGLTAGDIIEIFKQVVQAILFLTTTAIVWWFGSRPTNTGRS